MNDVSARNLQTRHKQWYFGNSLDGFIPMAPCIVTKDELSQGVTLKTGTIIAMGTPAGVGMGFEPPGFLKARDLVECEIEDIGSLRNTVK